MISKSIYTILSSKPHNPHYLNRYIKFIQSCNEHNTYQISVKFEKHHICPKAEDMFPEYSSFKKNPWNCSKLSLRQHFIAHNLLYKIYKNDSSCRAFWMLKHTRIGLSVNSKTYELLKSDYIKSLSGKNNFWFGTKGPMGGKAQSKETIDKRSKSNTGKKRSKEFCENIKLRMKSFIHSPEAKLKISNSKTGIKTGPRTKLICPHCGKSGGGGAIKQWHFDNCKFKSLL